MLTWQLQLFLTEGPLSWQNVVQQAVPFGGPSAASLLGGGTCITSLLVMQLTGSCWLVTCERARPCSLVLLIGTGAGTHGALDVSSSLSAGSAGSSSKTQS